MATNIALEHRIKPQTLLNLVGNESEWNPKAVSATGDFGLAQINPDYWPEVSKTEAFDPEFALNFAAGKIAKGQEYFWTVCSCVKYAKTIAKGVPSQNANKFKPNTKLKVGVLALFRYANGVSHVAVVRKILSDSFIVAEANFHACDVGAREVQKDDPALIGYWQA